MEVGTAATTITFLVFSRVTSPSLGGGGGGPLFKREDKQLPESEADTGEGQPVKSHNLMTMSSCIHRRCDRKLGTWLEDPT